MGLLGEGELALLRKDVEDTLPDEATIQRVTLTSDGAGGENESWADLGTVPCRFDPYGSSGSASLRAGGEHGSAGSRIDSREVHMVTMPANTDLTQKDRLKKPTGEIFEIVLVQEHGSWELARIAVAKEKF